MGITYLTLVLENPRFNLKLRSAIVYILALSFLTLTFISSLSIRDFVNSTLSITLLDPVVDKNLLIQSDEVPLESVIKFRARKGDTINSILKEQGLNKEEIVEILKFPEVQKLSSTLKIGQPIILEYEFKIMEGEDDLTHEMRILNKIIFEIDKVNSLHLIRENGKFIAQSKIVALNKVINKSHAVINSNFIAALKSLGLSAASIVELVNAYNHQLDFQRQIKPEDTITVITEKFVTPTGEFSHHGKILYASLNTTGKEFNIYRYSPDKSDNEQKFFSEDGKSVQRSLLRNPLKLIRITSKFGNRKHPISGYTRLHTGVDFAAPIGTPVYAAGDGVVTEAGRKRGYGNFVQLKHSSTLSTAYGHLSKFSPKLRNGTKVKQGDIIAYVGNTGSSTGPHLHWEVKIEGRHVNPLSIKTTPLTILCGKQLEDFKMFKDSFKKSNANLFLKADVEMAKNNF